MKFLIYSLQLSSVSNVFGEVVPPKLSKQTYQYLKLNKDNEEDYLFLYELEVLKLLTAKVSIIHTNPVNK